MTTKPRTRRISVVIAVRNGAATLQRCLDSIFEQTYRDIEIIVIDGGSTDRTRTVLEDNALRIAFWQSEPDRGICNAWNKALGHVAGQWLLFLGADDRLKNPDVIDRARRALDDASGHVRVVYAMVDILDAEANVRYTRGRPWPEARQSFRRHMAIPHQGTFHHWSLFDEHGMFDESFRISGDYEFLLRELLDHDALFIPDLVLVEMGAGGLSDRPENLLSMTREFQRARRMHGLAPRFEWLSLSVARARIYGVIVRALGPRVAKDLALAVRLITHRDRR